MKKKFEQKSKEIKYLLIIFLHLKKKMLTYNDIINFLCCYGC